MISIPSIPFISVINSDNPCWDRCCSPHRLRWMHRPRKVHDIERGNFHQVKPQTKFHKGFCRFMSCTGVKSLFFRVITSRHKSDDQVFLGFQPSNIRTCRTCDNAAARSLRRQPEKKRRFLPACRGHPPERPRGGRREDVRKTKKKHEKNMRKTQKT